MGLWSNRNSALTETSETLHTPPPAMDKGGGRRAYYEVVTTGTPRREPRNEAFLANTLI